MGLFGKSLEEKAAEAVKSLRGSIKGLKSLDAVVEGKTVTLTGEADSIEAKGKAMAEFNKLVETENTINKIALAKAPVPAAPTPAAGAVVTGGAPAAAAAASAPKVHVVEKGDTLGAIAKKYYGKASAYMKIFEANKDVLTDPDKIKPGQKLRIPD
ncbi:MAG TPA: LysM peptidoglycan-binding domain-containing protein [Thermoanaerobaculia bacterium]|nr:LysM peptidoglycan-binding domain-containing protein [Thermoanaerobaculia bacterium]